MMVREFGYVRVYPTTLYRPQIPVIEFLAALLILTRVALTSAVCFSLFVPPFLRTSSDGVLQSESQFPLSYHP